MASSKKKSREPAKKAASNPPSSTSSADRPERPEWRKRHLEETDRATIEAFKNPRPITI